MSEFKKELSALLNRHSKENGSNTPDFILAEYLQNCLQVFEIATQARDGWWGVHDPRMVTWPSPSAVIPPPQTGGGKNDK